MRLVLPVLVALATFFPVPAQQSASYAVESAATNSGGHPTQGVEMTSGSFRVSLDAIGDAVLVSDIASASLLSGSGFVGRYPPPGQVGGLFFTDNQTLNWSAERSAGTYNVYRETISQLTGLQFGTCRQQGLAGVSATDTDAVPAGDGYVYLVTVRNRLNEDGTKGFQSNGSERFGGVCP